MYRTYRSGGPFLETVVFTVEILIPAGEPMIVRFSVGSACGLHVDKIAMMNASFWQE